MKNETRTSLGFSRVRSRRAPLAGVATILLAAAILAPAHAFADAQSERVTVGVSFSVVPGVGTAATLARVTGKPVETRLSLGLLGGGSDFVGGAALGSVFTTARRDVTGLQAAGVANVVGGDLRGVQSSGVVNVIGGGANAVQSAGLMNVVRGRADGLQVAGVLNVAGESEGIQLGLVNVSGSSSGVPIGLVSYVRNVGVMYTTWTTETGQTAFAVRTGNRRVANYLGVAYKILDRAYPWALVAGIGVDLLQFGGFSVTIKSLVYSMYDDSLVSSGSQGSVGISASLDLGRRVRVFAGPTINAFLANPGIDHDPGRWTVYESELGSSRATVWPGLTAGVRLAWRVQ